MLVATTDAAAAVAEAVSVVPHAEETSAEPGGDPDLPLVGSPTREAAATAGKGAAASSWDAD